jgi:hypothetical protein
VECYVEANETRAVVDEFYPPTSLGEAAIVADALWAEKEYDMLRELIASELVSKSDDPTAAELRRRYAGRLKS